MVYGGTFTPLPSSLEPFGNSWDLLENVKFSRHVSHILFKNAELELAGLEGKNSLLGCWVSFWNLTESEMGVLWCCTAVYGDIIDGDIRFCLCCSRLMCWPVQSAICIKFRANFFSVMFHRTSCLRALLQTNARMDYIIWGAHEGHEHKDQYCLVYLIMHGLCFQLVVSVPTQNSHQFQKILVLTWSLTDPSCRWFFASHKWFVRPVLDPAHIGSSQQHFALAYPSPRKIFS